MASGTGENEPPVLAALLEVNSDDNSAFDDDSSDDTDAEPTFTENPLPRTGSNPIDSPCLHHNARFQKLIKPPP